MKANKALKRLAKIEALIADVAERFSASAPHLRDALKDLKSAVVSVKEAGRMQASSTSAKKKAKKAAPAALEPELKNTAFEVRKARGTKKRAPLKKVAKKTGPTRVAASSARAATAASAPVSKPAPNSVG